MANANGRTRRDPDLWNRMVNDRFDGQQPVLSPEESIVAARKLYRHAFGKAFTGRVKLTSGNRYTWVRRGVLYVNPDKREGHTRGLRSIIHDLSHYAHYRLHPNDAPHSIRQARLERDLATFALDRDWHKGALKVVKAEKPKPDVVVERFKRIVNRRTKYSRELDRAKRLLDKARREEREYRRRHGDRLAEVVTSR